jgi:uncharacterized membrane protein (DUF4010 family)
MRRALDRRTGTILSAVLGGLISSTTVTTQLAYESRDATSARLVLGAGAVAACPVILARVAVAGAVLNPALAWRLLPYLIPSFVLGAAVATTAGRSGGAAADADASLPSPLQLGAALKMAAMFQIVLFVILAVQARWSNEALVATSVFVGLTDVDALTLSLARSVADRASLTATAQALVAGVMANTLLKLLVAAIVGRGAFRTVTAVALGAMMAMMLVAATIA